MQEGPGTAIGTHWGNIGIILGLYGDDGKENGNYYNVLYRVEGLSEKHPKWLGSGVAGIVWVVF